MNEGHEQRVWAALKEEAPADAVYRLAVAMRDEGVSQADLYAVFSRVCRQLDSGDPRFDAMADTLDYIIGFCSTPMKLFAHYLGRDEREEIEKTEE